MAGQIVYKNRIFANWIDRTTSEIAALPADGVESGLEVWPRDRRTNL